MTRKDLSRNQVLNIVDESDREVTVGWVAEQLTVDPSVASRMVSDCIDAGYLRRVASQADGRRTVLELTATGIAKLEQYRSQHRQAFVAITQSWPVAKRLQFARLLIEYADACVAMTNRAADSHAPDAP